MSIMDKQYRVTMPDNSVYDIPVSFIARHRAGMCTRERGVSADEILTSEIIPLFESGVTDIHDWTRNHMDWHELAPHAVMVSMPSPTPLAMQYGWHNSRTEIVDAGPEASARQLRDQLVADALSVATPEQLPIIAKALARIHAEMLANTTGMFSDSPFISELLGTKLVTAYVCDLTLFAPSNPVFIGDMVTANNDGAQPIANPKGQ